MEENAQRDVERPADTDEESNRAMLPLLQLPGNQHSHRITNFYIDNILRPDFGRKKKAQSLRDSQRVITRKEELRSRKSFKSSISQQGGPGGKTEEEEDTRASDRRSPDTEAVDVAGKGGGDRYLSPQAGSPRVPRPMLWPAWVYCTRYSDRPSAGQWR